MMRYLIARSQELYETGCLQSAVACAVAWAGAYAWFESSLDTRASIIRQLGA